MSSTVRLAVPQFEPLGHRSAAIEKALERTQYSAHKTLIPIGQPKQHERGGAVRYETPEQWSLGLSDKKTIGLPLMNSSLP